MQSSGPMDAPEITVVVPVHNERLSLSELHERLTKVLSRCYGDSYEIIFVDDGSCDESWELISQLQSDDTHLGSARFHVNFGKSAALQQGFTMARGAIVVTLDADLQDQPEEIPTLISHMGQGYDVVCGWRKTRRDSAPKIWASRAFNAVVNRLFRVTLRDHNTGFKAIRRNVLDHLDLYGELHRYLPVLAASKGCRVSEVPVTHEPRKNGRTKYTWGKSIHGVLDMITVVFLTTYMFRPLHFFGYAGLAFLSIGVGIGSYLTGLKIITGGFQQHYPLLMFVVMMVIAGIQLISIGIIGEFIQAVRQTKNQIRPPSEVHFPRAKRNRESAS